MSEDNFSIDKLIKKIATEVSEKSTEELTERITRLEEELLVLLSRVERIEALFIDSSSIETPPVSLPLFPEDRVIKDSSDRPAQPDDEISSS
jgi:hypothetical protein